VRNRVAKNGRLDLIIDRQSYVGQFGGGHMRFRCACRGGRARSRSMASSKATRLFDGYDGEIPNGS
jgi:hypothetical protein